MTSFTRTWNAAYEAQPADTENISLGAGRIRNLKSDIQERLEVDHFHAGDTQDGEHKKLTLGEPISTPSNVANKGFLYGKDVGGKIELHYLDEDGNEVSITSGGVLNSVSPITTRGDIIRGDSSGDAERLAKGAANTFLSSNGTDVAYVAAATQTEQEAGTALSKPVTPARQHYHQSAAKAWVVFNGTGAVAITASFNITSITDNGTGNYTVNIATNFSSANYAGVVSGHRGVGGTATNFHAVGPITSDPTAGTWRLETGNSNSNSNVDFEFVSAIFFGDQ